MSRPLLFVVILTALLLLSYPALATAPAPVSDPAVALAASAKTSEDLPDELPEDIFENAINTTSRGHRYNPSHYRLTTITFAANDRGKLYINGREKRNITDFKKHVAYRANLRVGTIIVIEAVNRHSWGGLIASLRIRKAYRNRGTIRYRTYALLSGRYPFRMRRAFRKARLNHLLKTRRVFSCRWLRARRVPIDQKQISGSFPYTRLRARYVWARRSSRIGKVFLRYVIGGERCYRPSPGLPRRCACRKSRVVSPGGCLGFIGRPPRGSRLGKCRRRVCRPGYECVSKKLATTRCIRKFATFELKKVRYRGYGISLCRNVRLRRRKPFMVPYA